MPSCHGAGMMGIEVVGEVGRSSEAEMSVCAGIGMRGNLYSHAHWQSTRHPG